MSTDVRLTWPRGIGYLWVMPLLLSFRSAAKLLGVGRGESLHALIAAGLLRPVKLLKRAYIPREQIEALARSGGEPTKRLPPVRPTKAKQTISDIAL